MYCVSPAAETAWRELTTRVATHAGATFEYMTCVRRGDFSCVQVYGYPIALRFADVFPLASSIPVTLPMPAFVTSPSLPAEVVANLRAAFSKAHTRPWFGPFREALPNEGFAPVALDVFEATLAWDRAAHAAGYPLPA